MDDENILESITSFLYNDEKPKKLFSIIFVN
jgi:hypothetical protein